jgi:hypothetical protein
MLIDKKNVFFRLLQIGAYTLNSSKENTTMRKQLVMLAILKCQFEWLAILT